MKIKKKKLFILTIILIFLIGLIISGCSTMGKNPSKKEKEKFVSSKAYNVEKEAFDNEVPNLYEKMHEEMEFWSTIKNVFFTKEKDTIPKEKLPEVKPDINEFLKSSKKAKFIWLGHSTILLNIEGKIILTDPVFSKYTFLFFTKRFQDSVISLKELPKIDYILISHDHYDHLDKKAVKFFKDKDVKFITPLGVGSHLRYWGIKDEKIIEKDWWEEVIFDDIRFIATPAQHFSGRSLKSMQTLWVSWVIQNENNNIYFSGDSGYASHFKEIGDKYGKFDIAFIEVGQYNEQWKDIHILPEEVPLAYEELRAEKMMPIHWGMFKLARHTWYDPIEKLYAQNSERKINLVAPKLGEIVDKNYKLEAWWQDFISKE